MHTGAPSLFPASLKRMRVLLWVTVALLQVSACNFHYLQPALSFSLPVPEEVHSIAFASCHNHHRQSGTLDAIRLTDPDLFVWAGDAIYPDRPIPWPGRNTDRIAHQYALLQQKPAYQRLVASVPVTGVWDDHDYGLNNGGKGFPWKETSRQLFLQFIGENSGRGADNEGIYTSYALKAGDLAYQLILLDTRYFREKPGAQAELLGEAQWQWLTAELQEESELVILVSGTGMVGNDPYNEDWADYPMEQKRLFDLLAAAEKRVVMVAGDKHFAEMNTIFSNNKLYCEMVASGVTHTEKPSRRYRNKVMHHEVYTGLNFGLIHVNEQGVRMEVCNEGGEVVMQRFIPIGRDHDALLADELRTRQTEVPGYGAVEAVKVHSHARTLGNISTFLTGFSLQPDAVAEQ